MGENPHDRTDPYVSAAIVTAHTRDGIQLAQKYKLPQEIQKIIVEHHGDTPVMYFYHKAIQLAEGKPVDISDFRYDGNRPSMKESAIVMLADTIEAAVRALPDPTPADIRNRIVKLVKGKIEDGQLSNAPLTFRDIDGICEAFATVLNGVFHERIEYPTMETPGRMMFTTDNGTNKPKKPTKAAKPAEKAAPAETPKQAAPKAENTAASASKPAEQPKEMPAKSESKAELKPAMAKVEAADTVKPEAVEKAAPEVQLQPETKAEPPVAEKAADTEKTAETEKTVAVPSKTEESAESQKEENA